VEGRRLLALVAPGSLRDALERMFRDWSVEVSFADDGEQLLHRLHDGQIKAAEWDAILLDAGDTPFDVLEQLSVLRATPSTNLPRIVAMVRDDDPLAGRLSHCIDVCVAKPVRRGRLRTALVETPGQDQRLDTRASGMCSQEQVAESLITDSMAGRVLLVEDNSVNQLVAQGMLASIGCEVSIAANGQIAVDRLAVEDFDLVLMDCQMPVLDGFSATRMIRNRGQRVPIIALTANAVAGDRERCLAIGMDDYLCKPFTLDALRQVLQRWLPRADGDGRESDLPEDHPEDQAGDVRHSA
jgi:CheY-like chemotaxis protein